MHPCPSTHGEEGKRKNGRKGTGGQCTYQAKQATLTGGLANFLRTTVGLAVLDCVTASATAGIPFFPPGCSGSSRTMTAGFGQTTKVDKTSATARGEGHEMPIGVYYCYRWRPKAKHSLTDLT